MFQSSCWNGASEVVTHNYYRARPPWWVDIFDNHNTTAPFPFPGNLPTPPLRATNLPEIVDAFATLSPRVRDRGYLCSAWVVVTLFNGLPLSDFSYIGQLDRLLLTVLFF